MVKPTGLQLLTKKEVARLLDRSVRMVERLVASGTLTAVKICGAVRFRQGGKLQETRSYYLR